MPSLLAQKKASSGARKESEIQAQYDAMKSRLEAKWKIEFDYMIDHVWCDTDDYILTVLVSSSEKVRHCIINTASIYDEGFPNQFISWVKEYAKERKDICCKACCDSFSNECCKIEVTLVADDDDKEED